MAFPSVVATTSGNSASLAATHNITLPAGSTGDYILLAFVLQGEAPPATLSGFTTLFTEDTGTSSQHSLTVYYKLASVNTTENFDIFTSGMVASTFAAYRISNWNGISHTSAASSSGSQPQPPSHNAGSALDYLWLTATSWSGTGTISGYPYASSQVTSQWAHVDGVAVAASTKQLNASSDTPGAFTISASPEWAACTIAITGTGGSGSVNTTEQDDTLDAFAFAVAPPPNELADYSTAAGAFTPPGGFEQSDTAVASGDVTPWADVRNGVFEQADTANAVGVVSGARVNEGSDTVSATGALGTTCGIVKVYSGGAWVAAPTKVNIGGVWYTARAIKVYVGGAWVGCS